MEALTPDAMRESCYETGPGKRPRTREDCVSLGVKNRGDSWEQSTLTEQALLQARTGPVAQQSLVPESVRSEVLRAAVPLGQGELQELLHLGVLLLR